MTPGFDVGTLCALLISVGLALALAATPLLAWADPAPDHATRRISTLDGLRGFLALAVVTYHGTIYRGFAQDGLWRPMSALSLVLGQAGVSMFFMVTGYLFWRRLVLAGGRVDWLRLYVGRVFRIGPMFLLASAIAIAFSFQAGRHVHLPLPILLKQIGYYFALGALPAVSVHGYDTNLLLAGVTWSLQWEWIFYASLPALAVLAGAGRLHVLFAAALFLLPLSTLWLGMPGHVDLLHPELLCLFGAGAFTASLHVLGWHPRGDAPLISVVATALLATALFGFDSAGAREAILIWSLLFFLVATGCSLFGLLRTRAAHRLGHLSYGIYLLQGLALAAIIRPLHRLSAASALTHLALIAAATALLLAMALLAHRWVELPGIRLGDRLLRRLAPNGGREPRRMIVPRPDRNT